MHTSPASRSHPHPLRWLAWLGSMLVSACGDECPTLTLCDVRDASCQQHVARIAMCLRGGEPAEPSVQIVDRSDLVDESFVESETARTLRRALALYGLEPATTDPMQDQTDYWDTVGAFYSSTDQAVTIIDSGRRMDSAAAVTLLLHEFVHAMQDVTLTDADYERNASTWDQSLAFSAVREGEATLYEDLALLHGFDRDPDDVAWRRVFDRYQADNLARARDDEHKYQLAGRRFLYAFGGDYVNAVWRSGGNPSVQAIYDAVPGSTREIIFGDPLQDGHASRLTEHPDDVGQPVLDPTLGYALLATRHLGVWMFDAFFARFASPLASPALDDHGFAGSVFTAWHNAATDHVTGFWRMRFDSPRDARAFVDALRMPDDMEVTLADRDVMLVAGTHAPFAASIAAALEWQPAAANDWALDAASASHLHTMHCTIVE